MAVPTVCKDIQAEKPCARACRGEAYERVLHVPRVPQEVSLIRITAHAHEQASSKLGVRSRNGEFVKHCVYSAVFLDNQYLVGLVVEW